MLRPHYLSRILNFLLAEFNTAFIENLELRPSPQSSIYRASLYGGGRRKLDSAPDTKLGLASDRADLGLSTHTSVHAGSRTRCSALTVP